MRRDHYKVFSEGRIANLGLPNRLVRSATWDPAILRERRMTAETLDLYRAVAEGGVGLIITGDFSVVPKGLLNEGESCGRAYSYADVKIRGFERLVDTVHHASPRGKIIAQLSAAYSGVSPSGVDAPFVGENTRPLSTGEVRTIVACFIEAIAGVKADGFDGVQLHAVHGGLLSRFLSPYTNRRNDGYGGSVQNRTRIVREIVSGARERVGHFPILVKINCTDYVDGGIDIDTFPEVAREVEDSGVDAIEVSGGMWECLTKTEKELGFRPVPAPESHTGITSSSKQSYFVQYAEKLDVRIPVILVGGNRDIERMEQIARFSNVDFLAMCRPLINEPSLPKRWLRGEGGSGTECIACNSCIYDVLIRRERGEPRVPTCLFKRDRRRVRVAQEWLRSWAERHVIK